MGIVLSTTLVAISMAAYCSYYNRSKTHDSIDTGSFVIDLVYYIIAGCWYLLLITHLALEYVYRKLIKRFTSSSTQRPESVASPLETSAISKNNRPGAKPLTILIAPPIAHHKVRTIRISCSGTNNDGSPCKNLVRLDFKDSDGSEGAEGDRPRVLYCHFHRDQGH
jgi:hypothetical protein